ncbi:UBA-like protein [Dioscorea alata]|uniref:UBA-like protein n=1 Tax=Dioscorea alata TaxID=55571 RepID=A0ACB7WDA8_DIOAL|nr:UBA-like protein [Dioscorea alata]
MSGGGGGRGAGVAGIPAGARKMVASLKEIVNCPEAEIYAMLKECGMDPSEAVHRLLSQDTFHEVKSKREKKKEVKEVPENRSRSVGAKSNRGARGGTDRGPRNNPSQFSSSDFGVARGKAVHQKENSENAIPTSSLESASSATYHNKSDFASMRTPAPTTVVPDGLSYPVQPSSGYQNSWFGAPGRRSMADVVKMGRPQGKSPSVPAVASDSSYTPSVPLLSDMPPLCQRPSPSVLPGESNQESHSSQNPILKSTEITHEQNTSVGSHGSHDDWVVVDESPAATVPSVPETSGSSTLYAETPTLADGNNLHVNPHLNETEELEDDTTDEDLHAEHTGSVSLSDRQVQLDNLGDDSHQTDDSINNMSSYQSQRHAFEHHEVEDVNAEISSVAANLHQINLQKDLDAPSAEEIPAVIIPDHLLVTNVDCSHLSFGSFNSGIITAGFSGSFSSKPMKTSLDVAPVTEDTSSIDKSEARNTEYYDSEQLRSTLSENVASTSTTTTREDAPSVTEPEIIRTDSLDATHGLQYNFPSVSDYTLPSTSEQNAAGYGFPQSNSQIQNLAPFSSLMQQYNSSFPNNSLASQLQPVRNFDLPFSPLLTTQSVPTKYSTSMSSISGPTSSMPEAAKPGFLSPPHPTQQSLPSTSIPTGHALPQHLPVHAYSQPTLPLGHFANMISYPFLPQSYAYMPSAAFQQTYTANTPFHQSLTAISNTGVKYTLPQYKSSVSVTSLPQSAAVASGYGGFGSSANIPGSLMMNPSSASANTTIGFDEALSSQYKEGNLHAPQQTENPAMWAHGAGSRTMSAMPANTFYSFLGQNQLGGYRQGQQPQHYGNMSYPPNYYHSQAGVSQEHQQNPAEANMNNQQGAPSQQQSHQIWQHSY